MKKISKWYWIAAALLLIWAAKDIYAYLTMGQELLVAYSDVYSVREMVKGDLIWAGVKAGLAVFLPVVGVWRNKKKPLKSLHAVTGLLILSVTGAWLISMTALTIVTAQEIYDGMYEQARNFPDALDRYGRLSTFYDPNESSYGYHYAHSDYLEHQMLDTIAYSTAASYRTGGHFASYDHSTGEERNKLIRDIRYPLETAVLFYDEEGNLLHSSDDDVMYFGYFTQEEWDAGMDTTTPKHYGWIDIGNGKEEGYPDDPYLRFRTMFAGTHSLYDISTIRVMGYFEGTRLVPVVMHYVTDGLIREVVESDKQFQTGPSSYSWIVSDVDRTGKLDWQLQFDHSAEYTEKELVTVYLEQPKMWDYPKTPYVYANGVEYESLAALTKSLDFPSWADIFLNSPDFLDKGSYELNNLLVFGGWNYADYEGLDYTSGTGPTAEYMLVTAIQGNPLRCALGALRNVYIVTGLLALALLLTARSAIKKHLIQPVRDIADAMEDSWRNTYHADNASAMWHEIEKLRAGFESEKDRRRMKDNEITRLNTALEYAKRAEENRRQMTSNIAHELKTPLAVIHSYAEGLKEHAAEEKRDKYIDVILAEAEHTDGMVLEMLDLSRLEAGKVKLSRDDFSIIDLTKSIFEKLEITAQAKNLQIEFSFPDDFAVTGDESRIAQVIENFATNAVKYTAAGGHVNVTIQNRNGKTTFSIENESPPLSDEALQKVWDTFYRVDESRSSSGTGLGLAIAKSIIELHGGKCYVQNTKTGVKFSFTI